MCSEGGVDFLVGHTVRGGQDDPMEGSWPQAGVMGSPEWARCQGAAGETAQQGEGGPWMVSKARALDDIT